MNKISCPHCHTALKVDETGYADILKQVRDSEFEEQLQDNLRLANNKAQDVTVKKLVRKNSTMKQKLEEARANNEELDELQGL